MKLFNQRSAYDIAWERKPWWKAMSAGGWGLLFFGLFASLAFVFGALSGEVLFVASMRQKSGAVGVSLEDSPVWFLLLMLANFVVAAATWYLFFSWLRERRK